MAEEDQQVQYVIVEGDEDQGAEEVDGLDRSIADALARHAAESGSNAGQQFQIVKEDVDGSTTTTIVVVEDNADRSLGHPSEIGDIIAMAMGSSGVDGAQINTNTAPTYVIQDDGTGQNQELVVGAAGDSRPEDFQIVSGDFGQEAQVVFLRSEEEVAAEAGARLEGDSLKAAKALAKDFSDADVEETEQPAESAESFLKGAKRRKIEKRLYREDVTFIKQQGRFQTKIREVGVKILHEDRLASEKQEEIDNVKLKTLLIRKKIALIDAAIEKSKSWEDIEEKISLPAK